MGASWYVVGAQLRWRRGSLLGLVALVGLTGALVLASAVGARRTETAYERMLEHTRASQVLLSSESGDADYARLRSLDGIAAVAPIMGLELFPDLESDATDVMNLASLDGTFGFEVDRPNILRGRLPDPERADELFVNERFVDDFGVDVGDRVELVAELDEPAPSDPPSFRVTIVGVGVMSTDVVPTTDLDASPSTLVTPALATVVRAAAPVEAFDGATIVLHDPGDRDAVDAAVEALGEEVFVLERTRTHETVAQAIRPQATAMWAFAAMVGVAGTLLVGQAVARHAAGVAAGSRVLSALGVRRRQQVAQVIALHLMVGVAASVVAVVGATAASPLFPIGRARAAEVHPGVEVHVSLLLLGGLALLAVMAIASAAGAWVATRPAARREPRTSALARALAAAGAPPRAVIGVRRAFEPGAGSAAVPVRSSIVGASIAVAAVITSATFATNLDALVTEPERYGQTWSVAFDAQFGPVPAAELLDAYGDDPRVEGIAGIDYGELSIAGEAVPTIAFQPLTGALQPTIVDGRAPAGPAEVALGARTMARLGLEVGDEVPLTGPAGEGPWRVVGTAVFPQLSQGSFSTLGLGTGALVDGDSVPPSYDTAAIDELLAAGELPPQLDPATLLVDGRSWNAMVFATGADDARAIAAELEGHPASVFAGVRLDQRPAAISTYSAVRTTPVVLAVVLAILGAGLVVHVLLTGLRRRRQELAVCRVLGMRRRDVGTVVRWQASAFAVAAGLIGVPLGVAAGRATWRAFADGLGVPSAPSIAWTWTAVAVLTTIVVANVAAAIPSWRARHLQPAAVLRAE